MYMHGLTVYDVALAKAVLRGGVASYVIAPPLYTLPSSFIGIWWQIAKI